MSEYQRLYQPRGSYFFTVVTQKREKIFSTLDHMLRLQLAFDKVKGKFPFTMEAFVFLPDHLHRIWDLPSGDSDFSTRWRLIKNYFSAGIKGPVNERGEKEVWQGCFWEHLLRDEEDWRRHIDYIHYNPVKHGYVKNPKDWLHSSFRQAIGAGLYPERWGSVEPGNFPGMERE